MKRLLLIIFVIPIIVGCAAPVIKPEKLSSIKKVSAVSLLGDELCVNYLGTTVFTKKRFSANVENWNINEFVQQEVQNIILADGYYTYIDISVNQNTFTNIYKSREAKCIKTRDFDINLIKDEIQVIRATYNVDTLIFVLESNAPTQYYIDSRTNVLIGYGLYRSSFLGINETVSHAFVEVLVIDTGTMEKLSAINAWGFERIDNKYWNEGFDNLSSDDKKFVEYSIKKTLKSNLQTVLRKINIIR